MAEPSVASLAPFGTYAGARDGCRCCACGRSRTEPPGDGSRATV